MPQGDGHVAELRQGRIGDHALDVVLMMPRKPMNSAGDGADHQNHRKGRVTVRTAATCGTP